MGYSEVQDFKTTNTSLDKSESGEVLAYKIGQQHAYPYMLLTVKDVNSKSEFNKFLHDKGYIVKTLKGMVSKEGYMSYLKTPIGDLKLGFFTPTDIFNILTNEVFEDFEVCAYLDSKTRVDGDLIYALV